MARNTTPAKPTTTGRHVRTHKGVDPRQPLVTDMASAKQHGYCSPSKGKVHKGERT